jgi:hypothetical protein
MRNVCSVSCTSMSKCPPSSIAALVVGSALNWYGAGPEVPVCGFLHDALPSNFTSRTSPSATVSSSGPPKEVLPL